MASHLPPPLRGTDPGSFARHTVTTRWPRIARRVMGENDFPAPVNAQLQALIDEIAEGTIRPLDDPGAPDEALWNAWIAPHEGQFWREAPWFFSETYFYRRILEATGYFQRGPAEGRDPFTQQKREGLHQSAEGMRTLAQALEAAQDAAREHLPQRLQAALWGNQADLSMWAADEDRPRHLGTDQAHERLLVDDTAAALSGLDERAAPRVDVLADNTGSELTCDLALVDALLTCGANPVIMHLKPHPTFVSDATMADVHTTLDTMAADADPATQAWGDRLRTHLAHGRLQLRDSFAWTSPLRFRAMPPLVMADLARADLVISKGDANYRRLLGDRHWDYTTPFEEVVDYFPAPLVALRTLKAEVAAGLSAEQVKQLDAEDPGWLVNGEWGVIQFARAAGAAVTDEK